MMWNRRHFLKAGFLGGALLVGLRPFHGPWGQITSAQEPNTFQFLQPEERVVLSAIIPAYLAQNLLESSSETMVVILHSIDQNLLRLPLSIQKEFRQLMQLLMFPATRCLVAGIWKPWEDSALNDIRAFVKRWETSPLTLLNTSYRGLHEIIYAAWYGQPESWSAINYPGPPIKV